MKPSTISVTVVPLSHQDNQLGAGPTFLRLERIISVSPAANSIHYPDSDIIQSQLLVDMGSKVMVVTVKEHPDLILARMDGYDIEVPPPTSDQTFGVTNELDAGVPTPEPTGSKVLTFIAKDSRGEKRHGLWVFHPDGRGNFFHGDRDEIQEPRWTLKSLLDGKYDKVTVVTANHAIKLLGDWEEGVAILKNIIEREGHEGP